MRELLAFTAEHVARLTGLSKRQLTYWDKTGFFSPNYTFAGRTYGRVYTFRDVVGLRVIAVLRQDFPLQELRRVGGWLQQRYEQPWTSLRFGLSGRAVVFFDPQSGSPMEARGQGQQVFEVAPIAVEMRAAAERLRDRSDKVGLIEKRRQVASSSWVIAGTRIRAGAIWNFHEAGYSNAAIRREYPHLRPDDIKAAIKFERKRRAA
jgi:DNA-binding transcriptional MerR regulator